MDMMAAQMLKHTRLKAFRTSCTFLLSELLQKVKPSLSLVYTLQAELEKCGGINIDTTF